MATRGSQPDADGAGEALPEDRPSSSSSVVPRSTREEEAKSRPRIRRPASEPPSFRRLTPYQARLDVEMDDTAVSKVRDPSVSISLEAEPLLDRPRRAGGLSRDAIASVALGLLLGALAVVAFALALRALG
jgi:hypothetical protein